MSPSPHQRFKPAARWLKIIVPVIVIAAGITFVVLKPIPVAVHEVKADTVLAEVMGTGTLAARIKVSLSPKIGGRLAEVLVDQNDSVRAGQLLARLDDGDLLQQVEISRAALAAARATVDRMRSDQDRAEAVAKLTRLDHQRSTELLATKAVAQSDFDKALQSLRVAEADLQRAQFAIIEAERQVATAEKTLLYQQARLADTRLLSPFDGLVVKRNRDAGEVVVPGSAVLDLVATAEIWVSAWVDETAMSGLAAGQPARVVFRSDPERTHAGEVARLGRQTDPETREFLVDVRLTSLPRNWTIGQRAEVYITTARSSAAATVPVHVIQIRQEQPGVFVAERGKARWRPVDFGVRGRERVEIMAGLAAGERVVTPRDPQTALSDGKRIAVP
jgi:RND family efflux transporter MFP subunit